MSGTIGNVNYNQRADVQAMRVEEHEAKPVQQQEGNGYNPAAWQQQSFGNKPMPDINAGYTPAPEKAGFWAAMGAAMTNSTFVGRGFTAVDNLSYTPQDGYNPLQDFEGTIKSGLNPDPDERDFLLKARSPEEYQNRVAHVEQERIGNEAMSSSLTGTVIGNLTDADALLGVAKFGRLASLSRAGNLATRVTIGGAAFGGTSYALQDYSGSSTGEVVTDALVGSVGSAFAATKWTPPASLNVNTIKTGVGKMSENAARFMSAQDELAAIIGQDEAARILGNVVKGSSDSISYHGLNFVTELDRIVANSVEPALKQAISNEMGRGYLWNSLVNRRAFRDTAKVLQDEAHKQIIRNGDAEAKGLPIQAHHNPNVELIVKAYGDSGWSTTALARLKEAGVKGADDLSDSKWYTPIKWSGQKMHDYVAGGNRAAKMDNLYDLFGRQFTQMFPTLHNLTGLTGRQMGQKFVDATLKRATDTEGTYFKGIEKDELRELMSASLPQGLKDRDTIIENMLGVVGTKAEEAGKAAPLKSRLRWSYDDVDMADGDRLNILDFSNSDLYANMNAYGRTVGARYGMAKVGMLKEADLDNVFKAAIENLPAGADIQKAQRFLDDIKASVMGRPVGERLPDMLRSFTTLASQLHLANSGLLNIADYVSTMQQFGIKNVAKQFVPAMRKMGLGSIKPKQAEAIKDILSGRLVAEGRLRPFVTHLEDNFDGAVAGMHETVSYLGQSTKYVNLSEFVRRHQVAVTAGIIDDLATKYAANDLKAEKFFKSVGLHHNSNVQSQLRQHGTIMENWTDITARDRFITTMIEQVDNTALMVRNGETPHFMQHTTAGKIIFPYMQFVFAATNKVLRRTGARDGIAGVAILLAAQAPVAAMVASMTNLMNGREWDDKLTQRTIGAMSSLGIFSVPMGVIMDGEFRGSVTPFAPINSAMRLTEMLTTGEIKTGIGDKTRPARVSDVIKNTPIAAVSPAVRLTATLLDKD